MPAPRGAEVWRDYVTDGVPSSGRNDPAKADARAWSAWLESLVTSGVLSSGPWFATRETMTLGYDANTIAVVYDDPDAAENGLYIKVGASGSGSWSQITTFLPGYQFVTASPTETSTANAIVATTSPRLPAGDGVALVTLPVPHTNTATPVTVSFDGGAALTIKTRSGESPAIGELQEGDMLAGFVSGGTFRLITDPNALIYAQRAEAAQAAAEAARDIAAGYASDAVSQGNVPIRNSVSSASSLPVKDGIAKLIVLGEDGGVFSTAGTGTIAFSSPPGDGATAKNWYREADVGVARLSPDVLVQNNRTINVPADYPTIRAAWDSLAKTRIAAGVTVTIKVADGVHEPPGTVHHPDGGRIQIIGNVTDPDACVVKPVGLPTDSGIHVRGGNSLGLLDGFTIDLDAKAQSTHSHTGILASQGGNIICGPNIRVNNWYYGIAARDGGDVFCRYAHVSNAGDVGVWAFVGGCVDAQFATVEGVSDNINGYGYGFQAEYGGTLDCSNAVATTCRNAGIAALSGGKVRALGANSSNNVGSGVLSREGGHVQHSGGTANNNGRWGWEEIGSGTIYAATSTRTGNVLGPRMPVMFLNNFSDSPSVACNSGPARLESLSDGVFLKARGFDAFRVFALTGNEVNYAQVDAGLSGASVDFKVRGADTNIDFGVSPKGTGLLKYGTRTNRSDTPITGSFPMKMSDGTVVYVALVAPP
ncbi:hypothetical protein [Shinella zoogloeoides]|uniref:hypothetical protein n=1 Tax=Shinella zoogloeoides TaxID=352475 RepID=UPI001F58FE2A|nr:hypothetical protein [Shinella zoogloeoides]